MVSSRHILQCDPAHLSATVLIEWLPACWPLPQTLGHTLPYLGQCRGVVGRGPPGRAGIPL